MLHYLPSGMRYILLHTPWIKWVSSLTTARAALIVIPPNVLCWSRMSKGGVGGGTAVGAEPSHQYSITFCCHVTDSSKRSVWHNCHLTRMKQKYRTEFFHMEKMVPIDFYSCLLNVSGDQTVDLSIAKWWVVHFSSGNSDLKDKTHSRLPCTAAIPQNDEVSISSSARISGLWAELCPRAEYQLQPLGTMVTML